MTNAWEEKTFKINFKNDFFCPFSLSIFLFRPVLLGRDGAFGRCVAFLAEVALEVVQENASMEFLVYLVVKASLTKIPLACRK